MKGGCSVEDLDRSALLGDKIATAGVNLAETMEVQGIKGVPRKLKESAQRDRPTPRPSLQPKSRQAENSECNAKRAGEKMPRKVVDESQRRSEDVEAKGSDAGPQGD